MTRRDFSALPAAVFLKPSALIVCLGEKPPPGSAVVFERAYTACPSPSEGIRALLSGLFPHAAPSPSSYFEVRPNAAFPADALVVYAGVLSGPAGEPFDRSTRVPLAIRYPARLKPATHNFLVSTTDVLPTALALAGLDPPPGLHGRNLAPLLLSAKADRPESIFAEGRLGHPDEWRMIVRGFDKLVLANNEVTHLYNLAEDPGESDNLASSRRHTRSRDELTALLREWQKRTADGRTGSGLRRR